MERNERGQFVKGMTPWNKQEHIQKKCPTCGTVFYVKPSLDRVRYCSYSCARRGKQSNWKGKSPNKETRLKMRLAKLGNGGPDHWNYKGTSTLRHALMGRDEYVLWRKSVFERDNYTCQDCGAQRTYLQAHHIESWAENKDLRYKLDNGITLCVDCHGVTHGHYIHPFAVTGGGQN